MSSSNICYHCYKAKNWKYDTRKIKNVCGHVHLYHYNCYINLCKNVKNENNEICCFHCKMYDDKYQKLVYRKRSHKKKIINQIHHLIKVIENNCITTFDKLIIFKKMFCIIEKHLNYFKYKSLLIMLEQILDEVIFTINKYPHYDVGLNIKGQSLHLKKLIKKI